EVVVKRRPPAAKTWQTIGAPRMLVLAAYRMGYTLVAHGSGCRLTVFIDYALPRRGLTRWLGRIGGALYARWCVNSMIDDALRTFGEDSVCARSGAPQCAKRSSAGQMRSS